MRSTKLRKQLNEERGVQKEIRRNVKQLKTDLIKQQAHLEDLEQAQTILKLVGNETQQQLKFHISDIASLALDSIFQDPYKLVLDFVERRGKTECDIFFERDGAFLKPRDESGGGAVDVASFALRIAAWSMAQPQTRPVIIMDEPFRFLHDKNDELQERASQMIKQLSDKLGIQFIISTHEIPLTLHADKVFQAKIRKGVTTVKELE